MTEKWNRRQVLQHMAIASTALALRGKSGAQVRSGATKPNLEIQIVPVSDHSFRLSIFSDDGNVVMTNGSLVQKDWGVPVARLRSDAPAQSVRAGKMSVQISPSDMTFGIADAGAKKIQQLSIDPETGTLSFAAETSPLFGLGEGGPWEREQRRRDEDAARELLHEPAAGDVDLAEEIIAHRSLHQARLDRAIQELANLRLRGAVEAEGALQNRGHLLD